MMPREKLRRADVASAPMLFLLGAVVVIGGLRMPLSGTYGGSPVYWYTSPGLFPILIGSLLMLLSAGVLWRAVAEGGHRDLLRSFRGADWQSMLRAPARRVAGIVGLLAAYILSLALNPFGPLAALVETRAWAHTPLTRFLTEPDGINYVLCSFVFLSAFMLLFHRPQGRMPGPRQAAAVVGLAAVLSWLVSYVFTEILYVPLP